MSNAVDGFDGDSGRINLSLVYRTQVLAKPPNDNFADRIVLSGTAVSATGSNLLATKEPAEPFHADEIGGASVWWTWTAPISGTVVIDTQGSNFDTLLGVYTGSTLSSLMVVAANDDISTNSSVSKVSFAAVANTVYQIAVDGFDGTPGDIKLNIAMAAAIFLQPISKPGAGRKLKRRARRITAAYRERHVYSNARGRAS